MPEEETNIGLDDLKEIAKEKGIKGYTKMTKEELSEKIKELDDNKDND